MRDKSIRMKSPAHPGAFVRELIEDLDLTIKSAADVLEVNRATLSDMINRHSNLSPEMALRLEKAFGVSMETLMRMQNAYDLAAARAKESEITVKPYVAKPKEASQSKPL